ncbi:HU family DNA-binding protein [Nitrospira sp. Nam74]
MAKAMTKSQVLTHLAEKAGVSKKVAGDFFDAFNELAYKEAKNTFTIPGIGKLVLMNRKARMGRNPQTGEAIKIAAKRVVKFRIAKAAKDAILGKK